MQRESGLTHDLRPTYTAHNNNTQVLHLIPLRALFDKAG